MDVPLVLVLLHARPSASGNPHLHHSITGRMKDVAEQERQHHDLIVSLSIKCFKMAFAKSLIDSGDRIHKTVNNQLECQKSLVSKGLIVPYEDKVHA